MRKLLEVLNNIPKYGELSVMLTDAELFSIVWALGLLVIIFF